EAVNVAVVAPAATTTESGTVATAVFPLVSDTLAPPVGAAPFRVTVPVDGVPPETLAGVSGSDDSTAALTLSVAVFGTELSVAGMAGGVLGARGRLVRVTRGGGAPAGTVTVPGTVAAAVFELPSCTEAPPVGALPFRVTVAAEVAPPSTVVGLSASVEGDGGF